MLAHLEASGATAATLAIMVDGRIVYSRGYGWLDREHEQPALPDTPMRVASITKPIVAATLHTLVRAGKLKLDDQALPLIGLKPPARPPADPRWQQITIEQLLKHKGGWDIKELGYDPMFSPDKAQQALKLKRSPTPADMVRWMLTVPLQFDPGTREAYSNFGYCVLGRVIERVDRRKFLEAVRRHVFQPDKIDPSSVWLAHKAAAKRNPAEPWYDEKLDVDIMDANGGLVLSSPTLCSWLDRYWISGQPRKRNAKGQVWTFFGSMPGTSALAHQRADGVNIAAAFNGRNRDPAIDTLNKFTKELNLLVDAMRAK